MCIGFGKEPTIERFLKESVSWLPSGPLSYRCSMGPFLDLFSIAYIQFIGHYMYM